MIFETTAKGIPCKVEITHYYKGWRGSLEEPPEEPEVEFRVCDRRGRHAPWLEKKLNGRDWANLETEAFEKIFEQRMADAEP